MILRHAIAQTDWRVTHARFDELEKVSGGMTVPVLVIGQAVQKGFSPGTYHRLLNDQGFPN